MRQIIFLALIVVIHGTPVDPVALSGPSDFESNPKVVAAMNTIESIQRNRQSAASHISNAFMYLPSDRNALDKDQFLSQVVNAGRFHPGIEIGGTPYRNNVFLEYRNGNKMTYLNVNCENINHPVISSGHEAIIEYSSQRN